MVDSGASSTMISRAVHEDMAEEKYPFKKASYRVVHGVGGTQVEILGDNAS